MRQLRALSCVWSFVFVLGGCQPVSAPIVGQSHQSSCREVRELVSVADIIPAGVELQVDGHNLAVLHRNAPTNCCLTTAMEVELKDENIKAREREQPGVACRCICPRNLSVMIYNLNSGSYAVRLYRGDEPEPFWEGGVRIR